MTGSVSSNFNPFSSSDSNKVSGKFNPYASPYASLYNGGPDSFGFPDMKQPPKKSFSGKAKDFLKGVVDGGINTVKGLFSLQGAAVLAGTLGLIAAFGAPVVMPLLIGAGVLMGGAQTVSGLMKGDWHKVGEGAFTLGTTGLGARFAPKKMSVNGDQFTLTKVTKNAEGTKVAAQPTGIIDTTIAYLKAPFRGLGKMDADGNILAEAGTGKLTDGNGLLSLGKDHASQQASRVKQQFNYASGSSKSSASNAETGPTPQASTPAETMETTPATGTSEATASNRTTQIATRKLNDASNAPIPAPSGTDQAATVSANSAAAPVPGSESSLVGTAAASDNAIPLLGENNGPGQSDPHHSLLNLDTIQNMGKKAGQEAGSGALTASALNGATNTGNPL